MCYFEYKNTKVKITRRVRATTIAMIMLSMLAVNFRFVQAPIAEAFSGVGNGSTDFPFRIETCEQLQEMESDHNASYILMNDIDCSASSSWNGGQGFAPISGFSGIFDGQDHSIDQLAMTRTGITGNYFGLFARAMDATIKNVHLTNTNIQAANNVGGIVGEAAHTIVSHVSVAGTVTGISTVGGAIGMADSDSTIENVGVTAAVTATNGGAGGVAHTASNTSIMNSYFNGTLSGTTGPNAGIVSNVTVFTGESNALQNNYSTGTLNGDADLAGLIGSIFIFGTGTFSINNNFTTITGTSPIPAIYSSVVIGTPSLLNNYFDQTATQTASCTGDESVVGDCTAVNTDGTDSDHFKSLSVEPIASWNLTDDWTIDSGYPILRAATPSSYSDPVEPGVPSNIVVEPGDGKIVGAHWDPPADDGGSAITDYNVEIATAAEAFTDWSPVGRVPSADPSIGELTGFANGDVFELRVYAVNAIGVGVASAPSDPFTIGGPPSVVQNLTTTRHTGTGTLTIDWDAPASDGGYEMVNYLVYIREHGTSWGDPAEVAVPTTTYDATELVLGTHYDVKVVAVNTLGQGNPVEVDNIYFQAATYEISTCQELQEMYLDPTGSYTLANDIDCSGSGALNDGDGFLPIQDFTGTLDGQNHAINDLNVIQTDSDAGIFSNTLNATIQNVSIVRGRFTSQNNVGSFIGTADGELHLDHVSSSADVETGNGFSGGIVGYFNAYDDGTSTSITNASFSGDITNEGDPDGILFYSGGLIGYASQSSFADVVIDNFTFSGSIRGLNTIGSGVGGLIGNVQLDNNSQFDISNIHVTGLIQGAVGTGGVIGLVDVGAGSWMYINRAIVNGTVQTAAYNVGGIVGEAHTYSGAADPFIINKAYMRGSVSGTGSVGGIIGFIDGDVGAVSESINNARIDSQIGSTAGGIVGYASYVEVSNSYNSGKIVGAYDLGGIVGQMRSGSIDNSYNKGRIISDSNLVGGLIGSAQTGVITSNNFNAGEVKTLGAEPVYTAAVVGQVYLFDDQPNTISGNYFDQSRSRMTNCMWTQTASFVTVVDNTGCTAVNTVVEPDADHFINNSTNEPMLGSWDFSSEEPVWQVQADAFPQLAWMPIENEVGISTCQELQDINNDTAGNYVMESDIDCTDSDSLNGGDGFSSIEEFTGSFNGAGHSIIGLTVAQGYHIDSNWGLFGQTLNATIENLNMEGGENPGEAYAGTVVGIAQESLQMNNVTSTMDITGCYQDCGGLVGKFAPRSTITSNITNSSYSGDMLGSDEGSHFGGILGNFEYMGRANVHMSALAFNGTIDTSGVALQDTGGLIGGAFIANDGSEFTLENSEVSGSLLGGGATGGIIGELNHGDITNITLDNLSIEMPVTSTTPGSYNIGGAIGYIFSTAFPGTLLSITRVKNTGAVSGYGTVGGLVGNIDNDGSGSLYIGNSYNLGDVTSSIAAGGGLFGLVGNVDVENTFNAGMVSSDTYAGGIAAESYNSVLTNTYNIGEVTASSDHAGGIAAYVNGGVYQDMFNAGSVSAVGYAGALFGERDGEYAISNNYYDETRSDLTVCSYATGGGGEPVEDGCVAVNTMEDSDTNYFKNNNINSPMSLWDFETTPVWETQERSYPQLVWSTTPMPPSDIPLEISSCEQLQAIQDDLVSDYVLTGDIDCSETVSWNEGEGFVPIIGYSGAFDGNGYTIHGLFIESSSESVGLFSTIENASISDVTLSGATVRALPGATSGILVGAAFGNSIQLENVTTAGNIYCNTNCGGVVGYMTVAGGDSSLVGVESSGEMWGDDEESGNAPLINNGGIVGNMSIGEDASVLLDGLKSSEIMFAINEESASSGGIVGHASVSGPSAELQLLDSAFRGVAFGGGYAGGMIGQLVTEDVTTVILDGDNNSEGAVGAFGVAGGLLGYGDLGSENEGAFTLRNSGSQAHMEGINFIGGVIGVIDAPNPATAVVDQVYFTGNAVGTFATTGGIAASLSGVRLQNAYNVSEIDGVNGTGGVVGYVESSFINNVYNAGTVYNGGAMGGGLVGQSVDSVISDSFSAGEMVSTEGGTYTGSVIGQITSAESESMVNVWSDDLKTMDTVCANTIGEEDVASPYNTGCTSVDTEAEPDETYFFDKTHSPLNEWSFDGVWHAHIDDYPTFDLRLSDELTPVASCADLQDMAEDLNGGYELTADIDCSGSEAFNGGDGFEPIGTEADYGFRGLFEGNGHIISNLQIVRISGTNVGLFSRLADNAQVDNVLFSDSASIGNYNVGMVAGRMSDNTSVTNVGVANTSEVLCTRACGSVAGYIEDSARVGISYGSAYLEGIAEVGGVVGSSIGEVSIHDVYSISYVRGIFDTGGILGYSFESSGDGATVQRAYSAGFIDGAIDAGGVVGGMDAGSIYDSFAASPVLAAEIMGGLVGYVADVATSNNAIDADATGLENCSDGGDFTDCLVVNTLEEPNETYFFNNVDNPPLDEWSFDDVWQSHEAGYPTLVDVTDISIAEPDVTTFTITASAGAHGTISPSGEISVDEGEDQAFTITPASGYSVDHVLIDGSSAGTVTSYTFTDVNDDHTIAATFKANTPADDGDGDTDHGTDGGSGSGSSSNGKPLVAFTPDALEETPDTKIVLNDFLDYLQNTGKSLDLKVGDVIFFMVEGEEHSATIKEIGSDFVIVTLASHPFDVKIMLGQTGQYDVTEDSMNDIQITVASISGENARLTFKQLVAETPRTPQPTSSAGIPSTTKNESHMVWYWIIIGAVLLSGLVVVGVVRRKKQ